MSVPRSRTRFPLLLLALGSLSAPAAAERLWTFDDGNGLPEGWTTTLDAAGDGWRVVSDRAHSGTRSVRIVEAEAAGEASLITPSLTLAADETELSFRQRWNLEVAPYDGGVLEIAVDGGGFADILDAGGLFVAGGYDGTLAACCGGNPIGGRRAWAGGERDAFFATRVMLPPNLAGHAIRLRWRFATDSSVAAPAPNGWWIDTVRLGAPATTEPTVEVDRTELQWSLAAPATTAAVINLANLGADPLGYAIRLVDDGALCSAPQPAWLGATPAAGTLAAGDAARLWFAGRGDLVGLGRHRAVACVISNDPARPEVRIALEVTVASDAGALFCAGFESDDSGRCDGTPTSLVRSGPLNWPVPADFAGLAIDLVTGAHGPKSSGAAADVNLYAGNDGAATLSVYWYADVTPAFVGGVIDVDTTGAIDFSLLQPGGRVGEDPFYSLQSRPLDHWLAGATGYLGFKFWNEQTGQVNYGYLHLQTTAPAGFPVTVLDYAYDRSGAAIRIP
jgi:hypothetical protein